MDTTRKPYTVQRIPAEQRSKEPTKVTVLKLAPKPQTPVTVSYVKINR